MLLIATSRYELWFQKEKIVKGIILFLTLTIIPFLLFLLFIYFCLNLSRVFEEFFDKGLAICIVIWGFTTFCSFQDVLNTGDSQREPSILCSYRSNLWKIYLLPISNLVKKALSEIFCTGDDTKRLLDCSDLKKFPY